MSKKEVFTEIYNNNLWGSAESLSGIGSEIENTTQIRKDLEYLIKILGIKSILDVPCGDMLQKLPFNFPRPLFISPELQQGKFMVLYKIEHLIPYIKYLKYENKNLHNLN